MIPHMQTRRKTAYEMNLAKYVGLLYFDFFTQNLLFKGNS
ncbi:MAG: hypothetical protein JWP67_3379 [Mucilaginibacter sp.]|nr:hypothetical protein [Mucilaginibacter sp.]